MLKSQQGTEQQFDFGYTYNLAGALVEQQYPSGRVVRSEYAASGELSSVSTRTSQTATTSKAVAGNFSYAAHGGVERLQLGNGRWETNHFNSRLQPVQLGLGTSQSATDLWRVNYDYGTSNNNGNVASQTITLPQGSGTQTYSYDALNRLRQARETIGSTQSYQQTFVYDRFGNRTFDAATTTTIPVGCAAAICNPAVDATNNRFAAGQGYEYDAAGNLTRDAQGRNFQYDGENKQTKVVVPNGTPFGGMTGEYSYDGDGRRVKKTDHTTGEQTIFVYDAFGKLASESSNRAATAKTSYLTTDTLGTPRVITDQTGAVTSRRDLLPFGEDLYTPQRTAALGYTADNIKEKFTGKKRDSETGLDFFEARYYSNAHGRFLSVDPENAGAEPEDPQSWNAYAYALNKPTVFVDPDGLKVKVCDRDGTCTEISDAEARNGLFNRNYQSSINGVVNNGKIYQNGELVGTYQRTSFDDLDERANAAIFGNGETAGLVDRAPAAGNLALVTAGTSYLVGAGVGGLIYATAATASGTGAGVLTARAAGIKAVQNRIQRVLQGTRKGKVSSSKQFDKSGGMSQANKDFNELSKGAKVQTRGTTRTAELEDGTKINVRPNSTQGNPTLEIQPPKGQRTKIRYDN